MRKTLFFLTLLLGVLVLTGQGCAQIGGGSKATPDGGVFKSSDSGETWGQKAYLYTVGGGLADFVKSGILNLTLDPSDHNAIYAGSDTNGMFYSYNGGNGWQQPEQIKGGTISAIAIDPKDKCGIYMVVGNLILKSGDCNRSYMPIYQETRPEVSIKVLSIDPTNNNIIYAGNNAGDFLKSADRGRSWIVAYRFANSIMKMIINPADSKTIYVATQDRGLWKTKDFGATWVEMNEGLKQFGGAFAFHDLLLLDPKTESLLLSSQYGLIKTEDGGVTWKALSLLTPPNGADIKVAAVNPANLKIIYYSTPSTFYKSIDSGEHWVTKKLPSTRAPSVLLIDQADPRIMYLSFESPKKQ